jgi:hypothetical protein
LIRAVSAFPMVVVSSETCPGVAVIVVPAAIDCEHVVLLSIGAVLCIVLLVVLSHALLVAVLPLVLVHEGASCCWFMNRRLCRTRRLMKGAAFTFYLGLSSVEAWPAGGGDHSCGGTS